MSAPPTTDERPHEEALVGPIDYLAVEFPGARLTGEGLSALLDLVSRALVPGGVFVGYDDVAQSASLVQPGNAVGLLLYENTWAGPFVAALRREGADVIASGRIPASDVIAVLDELEAAEATGSA